MNITREPTTDFALETNLRPPSEPVGTRTSFTCKGQLIGGEYNALLDILSNWLQSTRLYQGIVPLISKLIPHR